MWFIGYDFSQPIPHFSTFGKNYARRFQDTDFFETIFSHILGEALKHRFVNPSVMFIDSTHVKANANKKKYRKTIVEQEPKKYLSYLTEELNQDRIEHGKKPLPKKSESIKKEVKLGTTDPDSGWFIKDEKERLFAYSFHATSDKNGFILSAKVTAANVHDSQMFQDVLSQAIHQVGKPYAVAVDAGYKTPYIAKTLITSGIRPVMPYTRPRTKDGFFKRYEYAYDEYYDCYVCPANEILSYETTTREGYRMYRSNPSICKDCSFRNQCTNSKDSVKKISRHIWTEYIEEADHLRHTPKNKEIYSRRKETIERVFADLKEKHGLRWTTLRGIKKVTMQVMLVFASMNLKKLATWLWNPEKGERKLLQLLTFYQQKIKQTLLILVA